MGLVFTAGCDHPLAEQKAIEGGGRHPFNQDILFAKTTTPDRARISPASPAWYWIDNVYAENRETYFASVPALRSAAIGGKYVARGLGNRSNILAAFIFWFAIPLCHPDGAFADGIKPKVPVAPSLPQYQIHSMYNEGDFDGVVASIDSFTRANKTYSHADSVFIAKHLAVIYTADPATREKGKNYMFRLLDLLPSARIVDMFVSDEIDHIFAKVREEYVVRQQAQGKEAPTYLESNQYASEKMTGKRNSEPAPGAKAGKRNARGFYWAAGGTALVVATGTAYYLLQPKKASDKNYDIPR